MEEPRPSLRKQWSLKSVHRVWPRLERVMGRLAFGLVWLPLIATTLPLMLHDTFLEHALKPLSSAAEDVIGYSCIGSVVMVVLLLISAGGRTDGPASVAVDSRSLYLLRSRERRIPRGLIAEGMVRPGAQPEVELHLTSGEILRLSFMNQANEDAQALLEALELGAANRRVAISLGDRSGLAWRRALAGGVTFVAGMMGALALVLLADAAGSKPFISAFMRAVPFLVLALTLVMLRAVRHTEVIVGAEGLVFKRSWSTRFVAYDSLRDVIAAQGNLLVRYRSGREEVVTGPSKSAMAAVELRVKEAMDSAARAEPVERTDWLDRRGLSLANWRASVVAGLRPLGGYRAPSHAPDDALRILEDPNARASLRIGAALALVGSGQRDAGDKVRIAAQACASDKLRIALSRVAGDEPDQASIEAVFAEEAAASAEVAKAEPRAR